MEKAYQFVDITSDDEKDPRPFFDPNKSNYNPVIDSSMTTKPVENESNKTLTITVEDTPQTDTNNKSTKIVINIDEVTSSQENNESSTAKQNRHGINFDDDFTLEFSQLIELCLNYEFSEGMIRILKRNIIPFYKSAEKSYIESTAFQCFMEDIIIQMQTNPLAKFSCLKTVSENLKANSTKRRVQLITLDTKVSEHRKRKYQQETPTTPQRVTEVIDLDHEATPIDVDAEEDDVIFVDERNNSSTKNETVKSLESSPCKNNNLLVIRQDEETRKKLRIKEIEIQIQAVKNSIEKFEAMEVWASNCSSPYIIADKLKNNIVKLYKEYCALTGLPSFERRPHELVISVINAPEGPAKRLQQWFRDNRREDGDPAFPDILDVVKCVTAACIDEGLEWSKAQILAHAQVLFTQCGELLQKRRQTREWRDLADRAGTSDPADADPALLAKLEANRLISKRRENELIDHYATLSTYNVKATKGKVTFVPSSSMSEQVSTEDTMVINEMDANSEADFTWEVPLILAGNVETFSEDTSMEVDVKPLLIPKHIDPSEEIVCSDSDDYSTSENEDSDVETNTKETEDKIEAKVKLEPNEGITKITAEETMKFLQEIDEKTLEGVEIRTIFDFEPTVVIEIDSSDSESDGAFVNDSCSEVEN